MIRDGAVLLVRRAIDPWRGSWDIPGGFCDADEHPEQTVVREVREEVGLNVTVTRLLGIWIDAYGSGTGSAPPDVTMNCYYLATATDHEDPIVDPREASDARWFAADELPGDLAFPDHARQVLEAWRATVVSVGEGSGTRGGAT